VANNFVHGAITNCSENLWEHLTLQCGDRGNAILLNGVRQTANREIGVPGFQPHIPKSTSEFRCNGDHGLTFSSPTIWLTSWLFSLQKYSMISVFTIKGECPNIVKGRV
jgi:hypothetical protein